MQHQVLEAHELAGEPEVGAGVLEMGPADEAVPDSARPEPLVEPCQPVFRRRKWTCKSGPRQVIEAQVTGRVAAARASGRGPPSVNGRI